MAFQIHSRATEQKQDQEVKRESSVGNITILEKYDGREISSLTGCIAKDLFCSKINQFTGANEMPTLYINDTVLR